MEVPSDECHCTSLMISQHWIRWWLQATSHYLYKCWPRSMSLYGHNELNKSQRSSMIYNITTTRQTIIKVWAYLMGFLTRQPENIAVIKIDISWVGYHYSCDRVTIVSLLWRHQQSFVTSSAERRLSEWDTGTMRKDSSFSLSFMDSIYHVR